MQTKCMNISLMQKQKWMQTCIIINQPKWAIKKFSNIHILRQKYIKIKKQNPEMTFKMLKILL